MGLIESYRLERRQQERSESLDRRAADLRESMIALAESGDAKTVAAIDEVMGERLMGGAMSGLIVAAAKDECKFADLVHDIIADLAYKKAQAEAYENEQRSIGRTINFSALGG